MHWTCKYSCRITMHGAPILYIYSYRLVKFIYGCDKSEEENNSSLENILHVKPYPKITSITNEPTSIVLITNYMKIRMLCNLIYSIWHRG
jgi:hypothetical protein